MSTTEITNYSAHDTMKMFTSLLPSLVMRALDCMDCAADEPDECDSPGAEREGTPGCRLENANSVRVDGRTLPAVKELKFNSVSTISFRLQKARGPQIAPRPLASLSGYIRPLRART